LGSLFFAFNVTNAGARLTGQAAYFRRAPPFLLRYSPYALDFYTAVLLFASHEELTEDEIEKELSRHTRPLGFEGSRIKTIQRWLNRFREDAKEHTQTVRKTMSWFSIIQHWLYSFHPIKPFLCATFRKYT